MSKQRHLARSIGACFADSVAPVFLLTYTSPAWCVPAGKLASINLETVAKRVRRKLDSLGRGSVTAVCVKHAEWRYVFEWRVIVYLLASGFNDDWDLAVRRAGFAIKLVADLSAAVADVLAGPAKSERIPIGLTRAGERKRWFAQQSPSMRVFRYGVDRHFRPIKKQPIAKRPKKPHPYPKQLQPFMYGTHGQNCWCWICKNQGGG